MEIFGKSLKEYLWPVKWYIIASIAVVVFQYEGMLGLLGYDPMLARITQWLWELFVAAAIITLVWKHGFGIKNIIFTAVLFSLIIHGLKAFVFRVFLFPYDLPANEFAERIAGRFLYGSGLVFAIVIPIGMFIYFARKRYPQEKSLLRALKRF